MNNIIVLSLRSVALLLVALLLSTCRGGSNSGVSSGGSSAKANGSLTIVAFSDISLAEGDSGNIDFNFVVRLNRTVAKGESVSFEYSTATGTASNAATEDVDYIVIH